MEATNNWGVVIIDTRNRFDWYARYVDEASARASFSRRLDEIAQNIMTKKAYIVRMFNISEPHTCHLDCACVKAIVEES